jgi:hypothetical protein
LRAAALWVCCRVQSLTLMGFYATVMCFFFYQCASMNTMRDCPTQCFFIH